MHGNPFERAGMGWVALNGLLLGLDVVLLGVIGTGMVQSVPSMYETAFLCTGPLLCIFLVVWVWISVINEPKSLQKEIWKSFRNALFLSVVGCISCFTMLLETFPLPIFPFQLYVLFLTIFHIMEFIMTAVYHPETLSSDSFLLNHSLAFKIAMFAAIAEFFIQVYFFPSLKQISILTQTGTLMCSLGQFFRTGSMWQAGHNFTHLVSTKHEKRHQLVTSGFYRISRHPSYFGWFWWSIGTQILLANPVCLVAYSWASWRFFAERIPFEEQYLLKFFGVQYKQYQQKVGVGIPLL